jgi:nickel/cobalt exporter
MVPPRAGGEPALFSHLGARRPQVRIVKRLAFLGAAVAALALPVAAQAHPLGNFTVNRFSRIEVAGPRIYVRYVLDLAEIPTFQAGNVDAKTYARRISHGARLTVDGRAARLVPMETSLAHPAGAGGLRTTRFEVVLRGPVLRGAGDVSYRDTNYAGRIGWKEIVVGDAPSRSHELRAYPRDLLSSPLDVTRVETTLVAGTVPRTRPHVTTGSAAQAPDRAADSRFAALVNREELGFWVVLASLGAALFWGMAHALSPGHGKSIVTAYLVGQRGTPRHAALLGLIVTATHTVGVFALGLVTLLLSRFIVPDELYPWLNLVAGVLVVGIGISVLRSRWRKRRHHHHHHDHDHHHHHDLSRRSLVAVGISGGLLPCPSALVVLLAAISLHRVAFGMLLVVAFSLGLALTITGIGLVAVLGRRLFRRLSFEGRIASLLPSASALVILVAGVAMTLRALPKVT